jgi:transketolase
VRTAFIRQLISEARHNPRVFLLVGDIGFSVVEPFAAEFPDRFVNVGVAEQNMAGVAAGLASEGYHVFTYSIGNFPTLRCLEQIRNDACHHRLPVTIVAVGGGLAYGAMGYSHHATEDLAIMRALPQMTVCAPGDPIEVSLIVKMLCEAPRPSYIRLGKAGEPVLHDHVPEWRFGSPLRLLHGADVALLSTGGMLGTCADVRRRLRTNGVEAMVVSVPVLSPFPSDEILTSVEDCSVVVTVEEHGWGGLGTSMAEALVSERRQRRLLVCRVEDPTTAIAGSQAYLRAACGLSVQGITERVMHAVQKDSVRQLPPI